MQCICSDFVCNIIKLHGEYCNDFMPFLSFKKTFFVKFFPVIYFTLSNILSHTLAPVAVWSKFYFEGKKTNYFKANALRDISSKELKKF